MSEYNPVAELSVRFLRAVKGQYGRDVGVDVLNALQPILGKDWSGMVVFDMLSDNHKEPGFIMVELNQVERKINCIKEVRQCAPYMGLKEAKDFVEMNDGMGPVQLKVDVNRISDETQHEYDVRRLRAGSMAIKNLNELVGVKAWSA